jgi:hypothetical protein
VGADVAAAAAWRLGWPGCCWPWVNVAMGLRCWPWVEVDVLMHGGLLATPHCQTRAFKHLYLPVTSLHSIPGQSPMQTAANKTAGRQFLALLVKCADGGRSTWPSARVLRSRTYHARSPGTTGNDPIKEHPASPAPKRQAECNRHHHWQSRTCTHKAEPAAATPTMLK